MLNPTQVAQMVLDNQEAIRQGVGRIVSRARLAPDVAADLVADVNLALLDRRGASFDSERASAAVYCRMLAWQIANDKLRSMGRTGGQGGAYSGFGNAELDAPEGREIFEASDDYDPNTIGVDRLLVLDLCAEADKEDGNDTATNEPLSQPDEMLWVTEARAAIEAILHRLTDSEINLWHLMGSGTFNPEAYSASKGITCAAAYVRSNRLRAKIRELVAA